MYILQLAYMDSYFIARIYTIDVYYKFMHMYFSAVLQMFQRQCLAKVKNDGYRTHL